MMWNFLSNRKHLNVSWRVVELPVETYLGRSNLEVSTPRLSMLRSFLIKSFEFFLFCCFVWIVMFFDLKSSHGKKISWLHFSPLPFWNSASFMLLLQRFLLKTVKVCQNKANKWKNSVSSRQPTVPRCAFFLSFLLHWVSEGHQLCHVVYMLTQKEGQVLAIRSLGLMWPGHGHGSSESPVEPEWHVVSIHLQSETFYANWQSVALAYPPPRGNSPDWCLLDMH